MQKIDSANPVDHLVLVIHGVGDPAPGETLSLFARSVAAANQPLAERQDVVWLDEKSSSPDYVQRYATHIRQLDVGGQRAMLAEVFWGDLSRVGTGFLGVAKGLAEILFGLQYVAFAAAWAPDCRGSALLRHLGVLTARILHGPTMAVTFLLMLITLTLSANELIWKGEGLIRLVTLAELGLVLVVSLGSSAIGVRAARHDGIRQFWEWVNITSLFLGGLLLARAFLFPHAGIYDIPAGSPPTVRLELLWYCKVLVWILALLWLVEMVTVLAMVGSWAIARVRNYHRRRSLVAALLIPATLVGFWGLLLPMAWLVAAKFLRHVVNLSEFESLFSQAVPMLGVQVMMAGVVLVIFGGVMVRYVSWRTTVFFVRSGLDAGTEPPRLIVHDAIKLATGVCLTAGVTLIATLNFLQIREINFSDHPIGYFLAETNRYAVALLAPIGLMLFMSFPHLRPVLDIILDVVNHFYIRETRLSDTMDNDEFDIREATIDKGRLYFARRDAIHARIKNSLAYFRDHIDGRPKLTIISHSQGTMIAIEVLNDPELAWLNSRFSEVRMVTMGSPFTHLYQYYFQTLYPPLSDSYWQELRSRLDRWINICRRDDFVGTKIEFPADRGLQGDLSFTNHPVGPRGHMNYWSDVEVLDILRQELLYDESVQWKQSFDYRRAG